MSVEVNAFLSSLLLIQLSSLSFVLDPSFELSQFSLFVFKGFPFVQASRLGGALIVGPNSYLLPSIEGSAVVKECQHSVIFYLGYRVILVCVTAQFRDMPSSAVPRVSTRSKLFLAVLQG